MRLELGEISEEDYVREEAVVFQALRDIRARKEELARQYAADRGESTSVMSVFGSCTNSTPMPRKVLMYENSSARPRSMIGASTMLKREYSGSFSG